MKLETARGKLTAYGLACGYVERIGPVTLWREHGVYHVTDIVDSRRVWQSARTLAGARKMLRAVVEVTR